jgi:hypothetical protein
MNNLKAMKSIFLLLLFFTIRLVVKADVTEVAHYFVIDTSVFHSVEEYKSNSLYTQRNSCKKISLKNFPLSKLFYSNCIGDSVNVITVISDSLSSYYVLSGISKYKAKLANVTELNLEINYFPVSKINLSIFNNLHRLSIFCMSMHQIPSSLFKLKKIKYLQITAPIEVIPTDISKLSHLEELYMTGTLISILPGSLGKIKTLTKLDLSSNELLSVIQRGALSSDSLQEVVFSDCPSIGLLPYEILGLQKLKFLNLSYIPYYTEERKQDLRRMMPNVEIL